MLVDRRRPRLRRIALAGAAALLAAGIAACTSSGSTPGAAMSGTATAVATAGGTARVALPAGVTPDWIWPYTPADHAGEYNVQAFQRLLYRPLYMFGDDGDSVSVNYLLSPAYAPSYSADGKTVTVQLKGWKWSNGETVDASDVIFWLNMMKAEPARYHGYVPGELPDNLASYSATSADTVVLKLKSPVSDIWFTYNQLAEITPMPQAWDVTEAGASPGSGGCTSDTAADGWARCAAVYEFLAGQAQLASTYASSPLWAVVDGPWQLSQFSAAATGPVATFLPNRTYSGSPRPQLAAMTYYAYRDAAAEYQALKAGQLDVGYVPTQDLPPVTGGAVLPATSPLGDAFTLSPSYPFAISYLALNFGDRVLGPAFKQLYLRVALQELVDQPGMIKAAQRGYGYPTSGGVPSKPQTQWVPPVQTVNSGQGPYAFSVTNATTLLTGHGWQEVNEVMTCTAPGAGKDQCGKGVAKGTRLAMTLDWPSGVPGAQQQAQLLKRDMAQAGIKLTLVERPLDQIRAAAAACAGGKSACQWDLLDYAGTDLTVTGFEPTGASLFATGGAANPGGYSDHRLDLLLGQTRTSGSLAAQSAYATYVAEQLPYLWTPGSYVVQAVSARLANVSFNPLSTTLPEYWTFTR